MGYDLIVHNGIVVTVNPDFDIFYNGIVCVKNSKVVEVKETKNNIQLPKAKQIIDANGGLIIPGLVNTHTHLPMSLFRGLADDLPLMTWLNDYIFPAEASRINPESVKQGTLLSCAELLLSGTTTCCDGYFYENEVAKAVCSTGLRAVLGQGVIDFPAPGVADPEKNNSHAKDFVEKWLDQSDRIKPSIFCHSPYTCSKETLIKAKETANQYGLLFQIHVSETKTEHNQILTEQKLSPVKYLHHLGLLDSNTLLIHAVWTD
ncbi:MAG: amidohydrolase family protein, partial [Desulfobacteraceae bacterium]|nr:amidohydrolase family protein [Desulfobacteraceae bacterium]